MDLKISQAVYNFFNSRRSWEHFDVSQLFVMRVLVVGTLHRGGWRYVVFEFFDIIRNGYACPPPIMNVDIMIWMFGVGCPMIGGGLVIVLLRIMAVIGNIVIASTAFIGNIRS